MATNVKTEIQRYRKYYQALEPTLNKPRNRAYTTIIFSFLVVSLFGWYAIRPTIQTIIYLQREIKDKTQLSKQMEDKITALIEAQAYYQEVEPLLPALEQALPTNPDAIPLLIQLRNLASASGTLITAIQLPTVPITSQEIKGLRKNTDQANPAGGSKQLPFEMSFALRGPFTNIRTFINGLVDMRRIVTIDGIALVPIRAENIGSPSAIPTNKVLQLALKLKAYYLVE